MPREVLWIDTLGLQSSSESNSGDADAEPVEHSSNGTHVGEPSERGVRGFADGEVGQGGERCAKNQRVDGGSPGIRAGEYLWRLFGPSKTVQGTGGGVQIGGTGGPSRG